MNSITFGCTLTSRPRELSESAKVSVLNQPKVPVALAVSDVKLSFLANSRLLRFPYRKRPKISKKRRYFYECYSEDCGFDQNDMLLFVTIHFAAFSILATIGERVQF